MQGKFCGNCKIFRYGVNFAGICTVTKLFSGTGAVSVTVTNAPPFGAYFFWSFFPVPGSRS